MHNIGVAVTGTGFMGPTHIEALPRLDIPVVGVTGSSPAKSRAFAERMGIPKAVGDFSAPPFFPTFAEGHREIVLCEAILRGDSARRF